MADRNYAYVTVGGILHVLNKDIEEAKKRSKNGKVVETEISCKGGYPVISCNGKNETVMVFNENGMIKAVIDNGSEKTIDGKEIDLMQHSELLALYKACI